MSKSYIVVSEGFVLVCKTEAEAMSYLTKSLSLSRTEAERLLSEASASGEASLVKDKAAVIVYFGMDFA